MPTPGEQHSATTCLCVAITIASFCFLHGCRHPASEEVGKHVLIICRRGEYIRALDRSESALLLGVVKSSIDRGEPAWQCGTADHSYYLAPAYDVYVEEAGGVFRGQYTIDESGSGVWVYGCTSSARIAIERRHAIGLLLTPYQTEEEAYQASFREDAKAAARLKGIVVFPPVNDVQEVLPQPQP